MNTLDTIMTRRSYRGKYKNQPVQREDLQKILEAGLAAPSGCNKGIAESEPSMPRKNLVVCK